MKWTVEFHGEVEVEADSEREAVDAAFEKLDEDTRNVVMADATEHRAEEDDE